MAKVHWSIYLILGIAVTSISLATKEMRFFIIFGIIFFTIAIKGIISNKEKIPHTHNQRDTLVRKHAATQQHTMKKCPSCGAMHPKYYRFCPNCGWGV